MNIAAKGPAKITNLPSGRAAAGRDRLLLVAMRLFAEKGFDSVKVRDISAAADVSVGLINHHFVSKDGLRDAVDNYFIQRTGSAIERAILATDGFDIEKVGEYQGRWILAASDEWPQFVAYLRRAIMDANPWGEALFQRYFESIRRMIDKYDAKGLLRPDTDRLWLPLLYMFQLVGPLVLEPFIKSMLGKSPYEPEMWVRFQKASQNMFWRGAGIADPKQD
jgi:TetR/AcrR family transcriptional regulator, regulator of cefoperazone and chloramphenicol sensitivity